MTTKKPRVEPRVRAKRAWRTIRAKRADLFLRKAGPTIKAVRTFLQAADDRIAVAEAVREGEAGTRRLANTDSRYVAAHRQLESALREVTRLTPA